MTSVVICAYTLDRWEILNKSVASVIEQIGDGQVVLVIDYNDELLARSREQWPSLTVVANTFGRGLSGARNTGLCASTGEVVAFLDDDAIAAPGWLDAIVAPFADARVAGVGGKVEPAWVAAPPAWLPQEFWWVVGCSYLGQPEQVAEIRNPIGANMAFRRSVFAITGGFREEIGRTDAAGMGCEETELSIRARAAGYTVWQHPTAVVHHMVGPSRTTFRYFARRCHGEGISKSIVSTMAGRDAGLSAERDYVRRTLPAGVRRGLVVALRGPDRWAGVQRAGAICVGVGLAGAGFARGMISLRRREARPLTAPPELPLDQALVA